MLHTMKWTAESGFAQADQWIISETGDSGEQEDAEPLMRGRPTWVESDAPPKLRLGPRPSASRS